MRLIALIVVVVAAFLLHSCGCGVPCPHPQPAVTVKITTDSGNEVPGVSVVTSDGKAARCSEEFDFNHAFLDTSCRIGSEPGTYLLTIGAPGYKTESRAVEVAGVNEICACSNMKPVTLDVKLSPES